MSTTKLLILAAIAGFSIFLGLPIGRLRKPAPRIKAFLNAAATGVLVFLLWDVLGAGWEPIEDVLGQAQGGSASWARFTGLALVFSACLVVGLMSLVYYDRWMGRQARRGGASSMRQSFGPGAVAVEDLAAARPVQGIMALSDARRLALCIAVGIGLHNFSEGLAIGQSAAKGEISLAIALIVGFGLHNATEGFGICAPLAGEAARPSWRFLLLLGVIGGGPTFLGTIVGNSVVNTFLFVGFLALAAGSILYVIVMLLRVAEKLGHTELMMWGLLVGLAAGFGTDLVLVAAGA